MVISPAGGSVVGISERLSDRLGSCCNEFALVVVCVMSCDLRCLTKRAWIETGMGSESEEASAVQPVQFEQDVMHADNPQYCIEYVHEIFEHLISTEDKLLPSSSYMDSVSLSLSPPESSRCICLTPRVLRKWCCMQSLQISSCPSQHSAKCVRGGSQRQLRVCARK
jgi:hypothetical protein